LCTDRPNEPVNFKVPKGNTISSFLKDRESIIVSEEEMHKLYDDYYNQLSNVSKYLKEKYGTNSEIR
jgi:hypothetical protein